MVKIIVTEEQKEKILLDTDNIRLSRASEYYQELSHYNKLDEALKLLSGFAGDAYWQEVILYKNLLRKREDAEEPEFRFLLQQCNDFTSIYKSNSDQLANMNGLRCYRVGVDAGAGFKQGDLDVLGTEGFINCTGVLIATTDEKNTPCYYLAHIFGERTTSCAVNEELNRILYDVRMLTNRNLSWSNLKGQVTLVGPGSKYENPSLCYKHAFKLLSQKKVKPVPLFGDSVAFNLTGHGDLIILEPVGHLNKGIQSRLPRVGHGYYSPIDDNSHLESMITIEAQILGGFLSEETCKDASAVSHFFLSM